MISIHFVVNIRNFTRIRIQVINRSQTHNDTPVGRIRTSYDKNLIFGSPQNGRAGCDPCDNYPTTYPKEIHFRNCSVLGGQFGWSCSSNRTHLLSALLPFLVGRLCFLSRLSSLKRVLTLTVLVSYPGNNSNAGCCPKPQHVSSAASA